jgi:hypothetical protein
MARQRRRLGRRGRGGVCACCNPAISAATPPGCCSAACWIVPWPSPWVRGRHAMNLLTLVLAPAAGRLSDRCAGHSARASRKGFRNFAMAWRWSRSSLRSACSPASTAAWPASSSPSTCPGSPRPRFTSRRASTASASGWSALHVPDAHLRAGLLALHQDRVKEFFAFLLLLEFGLIGVFMRRICSCSTCSGKSCWCRCTS